MEDPRLSNGPAVAQAAAEWIMRCDRGLSAAEARAFAEWKNADPAHRAELERIRRAWSHLNFLPADPTLSELADEIVARASARRVRRRSISHAWLVLGVAAAVVVSLLGWQRSSTRISAPLALKSENVTVLDSTVRRVTLPDQSIAELNGSSRIELEFTPDARRVQLIEGEAHFIVTKDPKRPFLVSAGPVTVRAVGTAFNVRVAPVAIEVLVTEGAVQVEHKSGGNADSTEGESNPAVEVSVPESLVAGQRAIIDRAVDGTPSAVAIDAVSRTEINDVLGWQTTRLVFNRTPLEDVVARFNHFNRHQLTLGDAKLRHRTLTGVFRADNLEGFIRLLKASLDVKAELRTRDETVLLPMK